MVAAVKESFSHNHEVSLVKSAASSHVAEKSRKPIALSSYLSELFSSSTEDTENVLDSRTTDVIRATWAGMSDEEIATASQTNADSIRDMRIAGYIRLGVVDPVAPTGAENHLEAISNALASKSFDFSDLIEKERINAYPLLHRREVEEAKRFIVGDDVSKIPQGGAFDPEIFQRRLLYDTVTQKLGTSPAEVALHMVVAEQALRLSRKKESSKTPHPIFPSAA